MVTITVSRPEKAGTGTRREVCRLRPGRSDHREPQVNILGFKEYSILEDEVSLPAVVRLCTGSHFFQRMFEIAQHFDT